MTQRDRIAYLQIKQENVGLYSRFCGAVSSGGAATLNELIDVIQHIGHVIDYLDDALPECRDQFGHNSEKCSGIDGCVQRLREDSGDAHK